MRDPSRHLTTLIECLELIKGLLASGSKNDVYLRNKNIPMCNWFVYVIIWLKNEHRGTFEGVMPHTRYSQDIDAAQDTMRCVADGAGELMFVSPALGWSLGQNAALLVGRPLKSVIEIVNGDSHSDHIPNNAADFVLLHFSR